MNKKEDEGPTLVTHYGEPLKMAGINPEAPIIFADNIKCLIDSESPIATLICFQSMLNVKVEDKAVNLERADLEGFLQIKISIHQLYQLVFYLQSLFDESNGELPAGLFFGPTYFEPKEKKG